MTPWPARPARHNPAVGISDDLVVMVSGDQHHDEELHQEVLEQASAAPAERAPGGEPYEQVEKLGELREQGILTDEELAEAFQARVRDLLWPARP